MESDPPGDNSGKGVVSVVRRKHEIRPEMFSLKGELVPDQLAHQEQTVKENPFKTPPNKLTTKRRYDRGKG